MKDNELFQPRLRRGFIVHYPLPPSWRSTLMPWRQFKHNEPLGGDPEPIYTLRSQSPPARAGGRNYNKEEI